ncbi:MAG: 16S rRNA (uracil(1498)-N(3))-methyltransferase [Alphaproteobacteria bacterium]|nr:16S rRNA (uracil(1498)-N(3))-methyltransferase [Alphaproteobacteria bacterium]
MTGPRLFVETPLAPGGLIELGREQVHYLANVMRLETGDVVRLFNGRDGEWRATIAARRQQSLTLRIEAQTHPHERPPDLWLLAAPLKKARLELMVEKASELGVAEVHLVVTDHCDVRAANVERLTAIAVEAAEQCGRVEVPLVRAPVALAERLATWPRGRSLIFCDEAGAPPVAEAMAALVPQAPAAILIGPAGGFTATERALVRALPVVVPVSLGRRLVRAETAAIAAVSLWQALCGGWRAASRP